jgi:hypothetical protein
MRILILAASALALSVGTSALAQGNGNGGGGGGGKAERVHQGGGHGGGHQADRGNRGRGGGEQAAPRGGDEQAQRGNGNQRRIERAEQRGAPDRQARGNGNQRDTMQNLPGSLARGRDRAEDRGRERVAAPRQSRGSERAATRLTQRRALRVEQAQDIARLRWEPAQSIARGCPPGLAKKNNGCMPPGQARQLAQAQNWYRGWWTYPQATDYFYDEGYLVRLGDGGSVDGFIPLLGGALWPGQAWPDQYQFAPVPDYHADYFGLGDTYDYRYADGAIFGVDPNNDLIQQVVALVAGDEWAVGQRMPDGYDIYNVPYEYRDDYQDTGDAQYRYSDGYVYQVDPATQLIQAAIQLIT